MRRVSSLRDLYNGDAWLAVVSNLRPMRTQVETPGATGFNVTIVSLFLGVIYDVWLLLKPSDGFAAGTITLPANAVDQQVVTVSCTQQIDTLTVAGNGATVQFSTTALGAGSAFKLRYDLASTTWHKAE